MRYSKHKSVKTLALLVGLSAAAPIVISTVFRPAVSQETTPFPMLTEVASDTVVRINGSNSTAGINEVLAERFETQYAGTNVEIAYDSSEQAIQLVKTGDIDLASIGRSLTEQELDQGLVEVPITRKKIAIIVGSDNPFKGSITTEQFAQIFRGEITDWSELGGAPGPIRFIDRPTDSDTRQALQNYPVFTGAPFETGTTATPVSDDDTEAVVQELGADGIGYAVVDQVIDRTDVAILPMHNVLPTDPRYPFSQALVYVYKVPDTSDAAKFFLGFISAPDNQQAVEEAIAGNKPIPATQATPIPEATATPTITPTAAPGTTPTVEDRVPAATDTATAAGSRFPWWLLLIPALGGLLWWFLKDQGGIAPAAVPAALDEESRLILTPRTCRDAYAYWEVSDHVLKRTRQDGGRDLRVRLYDVTNIETQSQSPHAVEEFTCNPDENDLHIPIATDNRDYIAELGYVTSDNQWLSIARSPRVHVPACAHPQGNTVLPIAAAAAAGAVAPGLGTRMQGQSLESTAIAPDANLVVDDSRLILVPRSPEDLYAYWELSDAHNAAVREQGAYPLKLRLYDTTDRPGNGQTRPVLQEYSCPEGDVDCHIPIQQRDRDYRAELGYVTQAGDWVKLAQSGSIRVPVQRSEDTPAGIPNQLASITVAASAAATGAGAARSLWHDRPRTPEAIATSTIERSPGQPGDCQIILVPRNASDAYIYWEVSENIKQPFRHQGGQTLMLRVHDATNLDIDTEPPHSTTEHPVGELEQDKHVKIPTSDRDYIAELGYYAADQRWLRIIRSFHTHVPAPNSIS